MEPQVEPQIEDHFVMVKEQGRSNPKIIVVESNSKVLYSTASSRSSSSSSSSSSSNSNSNNSSSSATTTTATATTTATSITLIPFYETPIPTSKLCSSRSTSRGSSSSTTSIPFDETPTPTSKVSVRDLPNESQMFPGAHRKNSNSMKGWLKKCGRHVKSWKWRFFILLDGILTYYVDDSCSKVKGYLYVGCGRKTDVIVQISEVPHCFLISSESRNLLVSAPSEKIMKKWIQILVAVGSSFENRFDPAQRMIKLIVKHNDLMHEWKPVSDLTDTVSMKGPLMKRGHINKNWKERLFCLEHDTLKYYNRSNYDGRLQIRGSMNLHGCVVSPGMIKNVDGIRYYFVVASYDGVELHLSANSEKEMHQWIRVIREVKRTIEIDRNGPCNRSFIFGSSQIDYLKKKIVYPTRQEFENCLISFRRARDAVIVEAGLKIAIESQLIDINGTTLIDHSFLFSIQTLEVATFPLHLTFVEAPFKQGILFLRNRNTFVSWSKRDVVVRNGTLYYYKLGKHSQGGQLKGSFSLAGCYVNFVEEPSKSFCLLVARSPTDRLILQAESSQHQKEWGNVLYFAVQFATIGITLDQIARPRFLSDISSKEDSEGDPEW